MYKLPPICQEIVDELKKRGFRITVAYYNEVSDACVINFKDPLTSTKLKSIEGKTPTAWFTSTLVYFISKRMAEINFNRMPPNTFLEFYVPEECGNGTCRIHISFDKELPRFGFQAKLLPKESIKKFIEYFFS